MENYYNLVRDKVLRIIGADLISYVTIVGEELQEMILIVSRKHFKAKNNSIPHRSNVIRAAFS